MHRIKLKITDSGHRWVCPDCGRVVSVDDGYEVIDQGDPYALHSNALHSSPAFSDTSLLGLDFGTDIVTPEEKETLDQWKAEFGDV